MRELTFGITHVFCCCRPVNKSFSEKQSGWIRTFRGSRLEFPPELLDELLYIEVFGAVR